MDVSGCWLCKQGKCMLPCGAPCMRRPCDLRCEKLLACEHRCPCVCGELCPKTKFCVVCGSQQLEVLSYYLFTPPHQRFP